jgi:hypothetical protein
MTTAVAKETGTHLAPFFVSTPAGVELEWDQIQGDKPDFSSDSYHLYELMNAVKQALPLLGSVFMDDETDIAVSNIRSIVKTIDDYEDSKRVTEIHSFSGETDDLPF